MRYRAAAREIGDLTSEERSDLSVQMFFDALDSVETGKIHSFCDSHRVIRRKRKGEPPPWQGNMTAQDVYGIMETWVGISGGTLFGITEDSDDNAEAEIPPLTRERYEEYLERVPPARKEQQRLVCLMANARTLEDFEQFLEWVPPDKREAYKEQYLAMRAAQEEVNREAGERQPVPPRYPPPDPMPPEEYYAKARELGQYVNHRQQQASSHTDAEELDGA